MALTEPGGQILILDESDNWKTRVRYFFLKAFKTQDLTQLAQLAQIDQGSIGGEFIQK